MLKQKVKAKKSIQYIDVQIVLRFFLEYYRKERLKKLNKIQVSFDF